MSKDETKREDTVKPSDASGDGGELGDASLDKVAGGMVGLDGQILRDPPPPRHGRAGGDHSALD